MVPGAGSPSGDRDPWVGAECRFDRRERRPAAVGCPARRQRRPSGSRASNSSTQGCAGSGAVTWTSRRTRRPGARNGMPSLAHLLPAVGTTDGARLRRQGADRKAPAAHGLGPLVADLDLDGHGLAGHGLGGTADRRVSDVALPCGQVLRDGVVVGDGHGLANAGLLEQAELAWVGEEEALAEHARHLGRAEQARRIVVAQHVVGVDERPVVVGPPVTGWNARPGPPPSPPG